MHPCSVCHPGELHYQIKITGLHNQLHIPSILLHLTKNNQLVTHENHILVVKESGIADLYAYFCDHMDTENLSFRIDDRDWSPIEDIQKSFHFQWIDTIIFKQLVTNYIQPIVDTNEEIYGYEMLARFTNEENQSVSPFEVFTAAKARNRTYSLDRVCRMTAVRSAAKLDKKVFINFIPTSIYSPEHCLRSTVQLANFLGIAPSRFVFEVVETEHVDDVNHLKKILQYYKEKGFQYALDDVGEGFSTIELLEELSQHYMKLAIKFVQDVASDPIKQATAEKFLSAALQIGAIPLAEGIETQEDFIWLKNKGYQLFQGYLFGKPSAIIDKVAKTNVV